MKVLFATPKGSDDIIGFFVYDDEDRLTRALLLGESYNLVCTFYRLRSTKKLNELIDMLLYTGFKEAEPHLVKTFGLVKQEEEVECSSLTFRMNGP